MINGLTAFRNLNIQSFKSVQAAPQVKGRVAGAVSKTKAVSSQNPLAGAVSNNQMFAGNTYGVNANIGVGQEMNIASQAGKAAGVGRTLAFA